MTLPEQTRLELVERLLPTIQADQGEEERQLAEVKRRKAEVEAGTVAMRPGPQVFEEVMDRLSRRHIA